MQTKAYNIGKVFGYAAAKKEMANGGVLEYMLDPAYLSPSQSEREDGFIAGWVDACLESLPKLPRYT